MCCIPSVTKRARRTSETAPESITRATRWSSEDASGSAMSDRQSAKVVTSLKDHHVAHFDKVHEPVLLADVTQPSSGECVTEMFGLPDPR